MEDKSVLIKMHEIYYPKNDFVFVAGVFVFPVKVVIDMGGDGFEIGGFMLFKFLKETFRNRM